MRILNTSASDAFISTLLQAYGSAHDLRLSNSSDTESIDQAFDKEILIFLVTALGRHWRLNKFVFEVVTEWVKSESHDKDSSPQEVQQSLLENNRNLYISLGYLSFNPDTTDALLQLLSEELERDRPFSLQKDPDSLGSEDIRVKFYKISQDSEWSESTVDLFAVDVIAEQVWREYNNVIQEGTEGNDSDENRSGFMTARTTDKLEEAKQKARAKIDELETNMANIHINLLPFTQPKLSKPEWDGIKRHVDVLKNKYVQAWDIDTAVKRTNTANIDGKTSKVFFDDALDEIRKSFVGLALDKHIKRVKDQDGQEGAEDALQKLISCCLDGYISVVVRPEMRCIVLDLGEIRVDNHGSFYSAQQSLSRQQQAAYGMQQKGMKKNKNKMMIRATQDCELDCFLYVQTGRSQLVEESPLLRAGSR